MIVPSQSPLYTFPPVLDVAKVLVQHCVPTPYFSVLGVGVGLGALPPSNLAFTVAANSDIRLSK